MKSLIEKEYEDKKIERNIIKSKFEKCDELIFKFS